MTWDLGPAPLQRERPATAGTPARNTTDFLEREADLLKVLAAGGSDPEVGEGLTQHFQWS